MCVLVCQDQANSIVVCFSADAARAPNSAASDTVVFAASGTSKGALCGVTLGTGKQQWLAELPGQVFSSPVVVQGRAVFGCRDDYLYAMDLP